MPTLPIFYFTYADASKELANLNRERKSHLSLLIPRFLKSDFGFFQNPDFTKDDLNFGFASFIDKLTIFHFSGHAGMNEIRLQDGSAYIDGIALQMKKALGDKPLPALVLVFINGCSTSSMVTDLLQAGVPIIIGTSAPVDDATAADFSIDFYSSLAGAGDKSIQESFDYAVAKLKTVNNTLVVHRGIGLDKVEKNEPLWGIFYDENKKNLLGWKLSDLASSAPVDAGKYEINNLIRGSLYNSLLKAGLSKIKSIEERRLNGEDIREEINAAILLGYPGPISYKLTKLLRADPDDGNDADPQDILKTHLNNLYNVYQSLSELLFLIMLSQLWDQCLSVNMESRLQPALPVDYRKISEHLENLRDFFSTTRKQRRFFDFVPKIKAIRQIFDAAAITYFVEELEQLKEIMETDQEFIACYQFFNSLSTILKNQDYNRFSLNDWQAYCEKGEGYLACFFDSISFCTRYDFGILKNIELMLPRFLSKPSYLYRLLKIPKSGNTTYFSFNPNMNGFTSVRSIVMLKAEAFGFKDEIQKITGLINLSPFMLDFNVTDPSAEKGNLLVYSHYDEISGNYMYEEVLSSDAEKYIKKTDETIFREIHKTFDAFFEVLFNEKIGTVNQ